jgi:hypothetical protein
MSGVALSPQCGFASVVEGNLITVAHQRATLAMVVQRRASTGGWYSCGAPYADGTQTCLAFIAMPASHSKRPGLILNGQQRLVIIRSRRNHAYRLLRASPICTFRLQVLDRSTGTAIIETQALLGLLCDIAAESTIAWRDSGLGRSWESSLRPAEARLGAAKRGICGAVAKRLRNKIVLRKGI